MEANTKPVSLREPRAVALVKARAKEDRIRASVALMQEMVVYVRGS